MNRFLASMIYVAVFLGGFMLSASIGLPGFRNASSYSDGSSHISCAVLDDGGQMSKGDSHETSYKTFVKKKIKKRFRARWCEYYPTPQVVQKNMSYRMMWLSAASCGRLSVNVASERSAYGVPGFSYCVVFTHAPSRAFQTLFSRIELNSGLANGMYMLTLRNG